MRSVGAAGARRDSDAASVLRQLSESLAIRVRNHRQPHPFGSAVAVESLCEVELSKPTVVIAVETDTIPIEMTALCVRNDVAFRVRFFNPRVETGRAIYQAELISRSTATGNRGGGHAAIRSECR